ncbi:hypothetical protein GCM10010185_26270 [Saccharothrix coeruleofusca]|uniref:Uncharacterized protein n=1 Tax=Saccharothrix coeruleofusca TaxID=33919 RepID=A0A918ALF8_9PSEU|nr:hypothetical protein GCM10010185_26270 [Saccharothrix coeruleofusca]
MPTSGTEANPMKPPTVSAAPDSTSPRPRPCTRNNSAKGIHSPLPTASITVEATNLRRAPGVTTSSLAGERASDMGAHSLSANATGT